MDNIMSLPTKIAIMEKSSRRSNQEDVIEAPILGVRLSDDDQLYYWTTTIDNETNWLTDDAGKSPSLRLYPRGKHGLVTGQSTGEVLKDSKTTPITATTDMTAIFKNISKTDDGYLNITLGNGETLTLEVFEFTESQVENDGYQGD